MQCTSSEPQSFFVSSQLVFLHLHLKNNPIFNFQTQTQSTLQNMAVTINIDRVTLVPFFNPFRLYSDHCDKQVQGRRQDLDPNNIPSTIYLILDPFRLYSNSKSVDTNVDMSDSLPFLSRPLLLNKTIPGEAAFDPFRLCGDTKQTLYTIGKAEIKDSQTGHVDSQWLATFQPI